jgi:hypothetical protein
MTTCAYCDQPATATIIAIPQRVCAAHASEFWIGLLAYTHARSGPCVKKIQFCVCPLCAEQTAEQLRQAAIERVERSPSDHADFAIGLAS